MSSLTHRLFKAVGEGRAFRWRPENREQVLARLLVKRAEAQQAGLADLEASLRKQIAWSLPVRRQVDDAPVGDDVPAVNAARGRDRGSLG